jgi:hypothetical protein
VRTKLIGLLPLLASLLLGGVCNNPAPVLQILEPADGSTAGDCQVRLLIHAKGTADIPTLEATLNGEPIPLEPGPYPKTYQATVGPGAPLAAQNTLDVHVEGSSGIDRSESVSFSYTGDRPVAREISDPADLVTGPLAHGQLGDFLLQNCVARFVVQKATPLTPGGLSDRDLYSVGGFGGNLIDAELRSRPGTDNFLEIQPAANVESVFNAQSVQVMNDGADGNPAIVRACGPDDLLDFINPSTNVREFGSALGLELPASADDADYDIEGCTEYQLEAGRSFVRMTTTIMNNEAQDLPLFIGDYLNAAGEVDPWAAAGGGIGEILVGSHTVFSYIGFGEASGVDYGYVTLDRPDATFATSDSLSVSGVTVVFHHGSILATILGSPSNFVVPAGGANSFSRLFSVGDGSAGNAVGMDIEARSRPFGTLHGCVTVGGAPAPGARVVVANLTGQGALVGLASHFVADQDGCYSGKLPVSSSYGVAGWREGTPYEGGGSTPLMHPLAIADGDDAVQDIALPATGRLRVEVRDELQQPLPSRVTVVGFDPSPDIVIPFSAAPGLIPTENTGLFQDESKDRLPFGVSRVVYAGADGSAEFDLEPGTYQVFVSRGTEYSLFGQEVTIPTPGAGGAAPVLVQAQIAPVLDTPGFVSSDFHVHGLLSADSRVSQRDRVMQFAGEGVDNIIMTEHHAHNDLTPKIQELALASHVSSTVGEEITTWDYGHFNGYPFLVDPTLQSHGSTDWAGKAPPGRDFPSWGSYIETPAGLYAQATQGPYATPDTVVQINHIDSTFVPLKIDTSEVPPQSHLALTDLVRARFDPALLGQNLFFLFDALEVWNGSDNGSQNKFRNDRMGIWFNHLNQGLEIAAVSDTDTHTFLNLNSGGARTWTASSADDPPSISDAEIAQAVAAGRAVAGQGLYVQAELMDAADAGNTADLTLGGQTHLSAPGGNVLLHVRIQAPTWAPYDRIEIYRNATTTVSQTAPLDPDLGGGSVPVLFGAIPDDVLDLGADFTRQTVVANAGVPGADRFETELELPYALSEDTWFVVMVRGSDGVSRPMFPVYPQNLSSGSNASLADLLDGNLGEGGTRALGYTNALYADVDGVPGFQAPGPRVAP